MVAFTLFHELLLCFSLSPFSISYDLMGKGKEKYYQINDSIFG